MNRYTTQQAGNRRKVLVTEGTSTAVLTTLDDMAAENLAATLNALSAQLDDVLYQAAKAAGPTICYIRRTAMAAVNDGPNSKTPLPLALGAVADAAQGLSEAQRRAVADEVGRVLVGTEDILVPALITGDVDGWLTRTVANHWLSSLLDDAGALDERNADWLLDTFNGETGAYFEGFLSHQIERDATLADSLSHQWHDVSLDQQALAAWLVRRRPDLADGLDDVR